MLVFIKDRVATVSMLFIIVKNFKAHKVKVKEIKRKTFSLNRRGGTLYTLTETIKQQKKLQDKS